MSKIKIETLTSLHIGSGTMLQNGSDFVVGKDADDYEIIGVISPRKILCLIGEEKSKIDEWVIGIERNRSTENLVRRYSPKATIEDYSERIISNWSEVKNNETLKEFIHDGLGRPYIPGSSIKGAIRTAVLAQLAGNVNAEFIIANQRGKLSADAVEKELFGSDPNHDVFRFLKIGDAIFSTKDEMVAIRMVNINERTSQSYWDNSKGQLIEALASEQETHFNMKLDMVQYENAIGKVHQMPTCMTTIPLLFQTINTHTIHLLKTEIAYWEERKNNPTADKVEVYLEKLAEILVAAKDCNENSCILRIGHGSGWRFITGAWTEDMHIFDSKIVPASRPGNNRYDEYEFPKSRRVDEECELLGFVRLTIDN